jgi:hypothetical protein
MGSGFDDWIYWHFFTIIIIITAHNQSFSAEDSLHSASRSTTDCKRPSSSPINLRHGPHTQKNTHWEPRILAIPLSVIKVCLCCRCIALDVYYCCHALKRDGIYQAVYLAMGIHVTISKISWFIMKVHCESFETMICCYLRTAAATTIGYECENLSQTSWNTFHKQLSYVFTRHRPIPSRSHVVSAMRYESSLKAYTKAKQQRPKLSLTITSSPARLSFIRQWLYSPLLGPGAFSVS